jgi:hypothetical protein
MAQATVVLIACSIVLSLQRDLYEDDRAHPGRPLLYSGSAARLRWFVGWFVTAVSLYYLVLGLGVALVEFSPNTSDDLVTLSSPRLNFSASFKAQDVYIYATRAHFIIVVVVALIVKFSSSVRQHGAALRWAAGQAH